MSGAAPMLMPLFTIVLTLAMFLVMILTLAIAPKYSARLMGILLSLSICGGVVLYGYGFARAFPDDPPMAAVRSLLAVCGMYVGKNDLSALKDVALFQRDGVLVLFWVVHLLALYTTASAAITAVGRELLKRMNLLFTLRGDLAVILGSDETALAIGQQCREARLAVVFVDDAASAAAVQQISQMGAALRTEVAATEARPAFLRSLRMHRSRRALTLYALTEQEEANRVYADRLRRSMEELDIDPRRTALILFGSEETQAGAMQAVGAQHYGYGHVSVVSPPELAARVMVQSCPPWECLTFDAQGRAKTDLDVLVIGFGRTGQAVFRQLLMNGQFEGSDFHAAVMAPDCDRAAGPMWQLCPEVLSQYDVSLMPSDVGSNRSLFEYLSQRRGRLNYIAVCVGDEKRSYELSQEILRYLRFTGSAARVVQVLHDEVRCADAGGEVNRVFSVYRKEHLDCMEMDRMAMALNHSYTGNTDATPWEDWKGCDYFSRMSSRASVDFFPALLYAVGISRERAMEGDWPPPPEAVDMLARTEHRRWCAFHFAMGFSPMSRGEFETRAEQYRQERESTGTGRTRIGKNLPGHTHACLVPWDELDELSERENAVTGGARDYKSEDVKNVLAIPEVLKAAHSDAFGTVNRE